MKKALVGCVNNVSKNMSKIEVWANSFKNVSDGVVCLVTINATKEEEKMLELSGIQVSPYSMELSDTVNNVRLQYEINTIKKSDWDWVLVTDVFDVVFQSDPFDMMISDSTELVIGNEGIKHNEEPWNLDVAQKCYPDQVDNLRDKYIYCSGVIGCNKDSMVKLLEMMDTITMSGL